MKTNNKIANRQTISDYFGTDDLTTHRILMNINWGFFTTHFGNDAQKMWEDAHPFLYPENQFKDYSSFSIDFIEKHFDLFSKNQFFTSAGWEFDPKIKKYVWTYNSGYVTIQTNNNN